MTVRVLVADDEPLARERLRTLLRDHAEVEVVGECADGRAAAESILALHPDLVFLDIQMPELDGFEVLRALQGVDLPAVIFVTAYDEYAIRAFEVEALDYLLKPVDSDRFARTLERALKRLGTPSDEDALHAFLARVERERAFHGRFAVRRGSKISFVRPDEIDWLDGAANYVRLHLNGTIHFVRSTVKSIEAQLDPERFIRVHRSVIVNIDRIASIEPASHGEYLLTMKDATRLTTSRTYSERLRRFLQ